LKHLNYAYQEKPGGIAQALGLAQDFIGGDRFVVILGDNIVQKSIKHAVDAFEKQSEGAKIMLAEVENPKAYGVARIESGKVVEIIEKPASPPSNWAVIGIYMFSSDVFDVITTLKPSARGELEITDVNNEYIRRGTMTFDYIDGWWADCGESIDWYLRANNLVARDGANHVD